MNLPQTVFTIFYAIVWGTAANAQPRWKAFAWATVRDYPASLRRTCLSVVLLNILPFFYFVFVLWAMHYDPWNDSQWKQWTSLKLFSATLPALAPFGFYRIWTAIVEKWREYFYGPGIPDDQPPPSLSSRLRTFLSSLLVPANCQLQHWQEVGIDLKPNSDLNPKWAIGNLVWGCIYILVGLFPLLLAVCLRH